MDLASVKQSLVHDIETLREPACGYVRAGAPHFLALFGRDSCIISWQLLNYDPSIAKRTIEILARLQGKKVHFLSEEEPGKILHEWHPNPRNYKMLFFPLPYYGSVDSTELFLILCGLYFSKTKDHAWLKQYWPNIIAALAWCKKYGDKDGDLLLEYQRKNPLGLLNQGWKDGTSFNLRINPPVALIEVQGYYYAALHAAAELCAQLPGENSTTALLERAEQLKKNVLEKFWLPDFEGGQFAFALDGAKKPIRLITTNPGHLFFSGLLDGEDDYIEAIRAQLFSDDMWTDYGIRTHAVKNKDFNFRNGFKGAIWPHDNWIIAQGLRRLGFEDDYQKIRNALLKAFEQLGKMPEFYAVHEGKMVRYTYPRQPCAPQGWASGSLLNFVLEGDFKPS